MHVFINIHNDKVNILFAKVSVNNECAWRDARNHLCIIK